MTDTHLRNRVPGALTVSEKKKRKEESSMDSQFQKDQEKKKL